MTPRARLRDLGINLGDYPTGPFNAITDVGGVRIGHTTQVMFQNMKFTVGVLALSNFGKMRVFRVDGMPISAHAKFFLRD